MKSFIAVSIVVLTLSASGAAFAQQPSPEAMAAVRVACASDFAKLCPDAKTRDDRRQCMMANHDKFTDACKAALADLRAKMQSGGGR
jgi:hypothetical protein